MPIACRIRKKIEKIAELEDKEIVSLGGPDGTFVERRDITLLKTYNLLKRGWIALPF